ncbi:glycine cleavage system protein R [Terasakiella pusilla]|uniref:glycine cleavage system protein R n=1 Tax=Terasakiella pusilla TaxID=64973 RepID=UPI00048FE6A7|nr:amino acid-binding protein [Terasakiella pusilla]
MRNSVLISVFAQDQSGLIAAITGTLFDLGMSLSATNFNVLGSGAEFTTVSALPPDTTALEIEESLNALAQLEGADVKVSPFNLDSNQGPSGTITHKVTITGGDRPGLIARLCEVFGQYHANIVRLNADRIPDGTQDQYFVQLSVWLPEEKAEICQATIANTAGEMKLTCEWEVL